MKNTPLHILPGITESVPSALLIALHSLPPDVDKIVAINHKEVHKLPLITIENALNDHDIVLSAAFEMPIGSTTGYDEKYYLRQGPLTSCFIALKRSANTLRFLHWWEQKIKSNEAYNEQIWLNHVPVFFDKVKIIPFVPVVAKNETRPMFYHLKLKLQAIIHRIDTFQPPWLEKMLGVK